MAMAKSDLGCKFSGNCPLILCEVDTMLSCIRLVPHFILAFACSTPEAV